MGSRIKQPAYSEQGKDRKMPRNSQPSGQGENRKRRRDIGPRQEREEIAQSFYQLAPMGLAVTLALTGLALNRSPSVISMMGLQRFRRSRMDKSQHKVLELFSPPRVTSLASKVGFAVTPPPSFDMKSGWIFCGQRQSVFLGSFEKKAA